mgnify:CR=1 FL=1
MTSIKNEKLKLNRQKVQLIIGNFVKYESQIYKITQLIDFNEVIGVNIETNDAKRLLIEYIKPIPNNMIKDNGYIFKDIDDIADDEWKTIEIRLNAIRPLLNGATRKEIEEHHFFKVGKKTCSFGLTISKELDNENSIVSRADKALYKAKNKGRNRVEFL